MADIRKLAEEGWDAYYRNDLDACLATYADDAEVVVAGAPPARGKEAIRALWEAYHVAFPDERPTSIRHIADGDIVVTEFASVGTHKGPLPMPDGSMLPATGRQCSFAGAVVQEVRGGLVRRQVFYLDNLAFLQQLGVIPAMEGAAAG